MKNKEVDIHGPNEPGNVDGAGSSNVPEGADVSEESNSPGDTGGAGGPNVPDRQAVGGSPGGTDTSSGINGSNGPNVHSGPGDIGDDGVPDDPNDYVATNIAISDTVDGIPLVEMAKDDMIEAVTGQYLDGIDPDTGVDTKRLKADLIDLTHSFIQLHNKLPNCQKWRGRETLYPMQIAMIMKRLYHIVRINMAGEEAQLDPRYTVLGIYQEYGENSGIYVTSEQLIVDIIFKYNRDITKREREQVIALLESSCDVVRRSDSPELVAVQNGIFNIKTKQCMPFSPEHVFVAKCKVEYNPCATNPVIQNPDDGSYWDVESWMSELFPDEPDVVNTLWEVIGAAIRPQTPWNKAIWLLSTRGNNGKGTLCELIRNLVGRGSYTALKLDDFSKDFALEPLVHSTAIVTDENDVGVYIDKAANLKSIITGDTIQTNRKFMSKIDFQFKGLMIQCINEIPKIKDKTESFYRRQLIIRFKKSYTGIERKYIKNEYMKRKDVLEYVLYKVLNMDYDEISEPDYCKKELEMYKIHNDPVRDFMTDVIPQISVDAVPEEYLYDLYKIWLEKNNPAAKKFMLSKKNFLDEAKRLIDEFPEWDFPEGYFRVRTIYLDKQELTLHLYKLTDWMEEPESSDGDRKYRLKWNKPVMSGMRRAKYKNRKPGRPKKEEEDEYIPETIDENRFGIIKNGFGEPIDLGE